ncbi:MAG: pyridoxine 5'-phosphate synthase [Rhodospirillaceae bacterium]|jgi:pyridoxine 5-phosphate synthase|nr:pyridoxine 5'-phosphate synthase [Rhodospirillaceae bacterium]
MNHLIRLGVNIDHVATIRNSRDNNGYPDPICAAIIAADSGASGITVHLREDRRHISENDIHRLMNVISIPLNLEMAATQEMVGIALHYKPNAVCIVPERLEERTTEGGLDVISNQNYLKQLISILTISGIRVSLFVAPDLNQIDAVKAVGASIIELYTGTYCNATAGFNREYELNRIDIAARYADKIGLECHAGHGLSFDNVQSIAKISTIVELNIGHFLISEGIFIGLGNAIRRMNQLINQVRN